MGKYDWNPGSGGGKFVRNAGLNAVEETAIDWPMIFAKLPVLKRLDCLAMPLTSVHTTRVVEAAGQHCVDLEALVLPRNERLPCPTSHEIIPLLNALHSALKRWHEATSSDRGGGLRQLTVPSRGSLVTVESSNQFLECVTRWCPELEHLDSYNLCKEDWCVLACHDRLLVALPEWEAFNATCTSLREFDWVIVPFADPFFRAFGAQVKPQLTKLSIAQNMYWGWQDYFSSYNDAKTQHTECDPKRQLLAALPELRGRDEDGFPLGYGHRATDASSALKGCPALVELQVILYLRQSNCFCDSLWSASWANAWEAGRRWDRFPREIFGDSFCETLAQCCPLLEQFRMQEAPKLMSEQSSPIETFTDRGLVALTNLPRLSILKLCAVNCTGHGVLRFLEHLSVEEWRGQRTFQIALGGNGDTEQNAFQTVVVALLQSLAETSAAGLPACFARKFVLRLVNACFVMRRQHLQGSIQQLESLVERFKAAHPTLRLRITTEGHHATALRRVMDIGLCTANAEASAYYGWDNDEPDHDVTFAKCSAPAWRVKRRIYG
ncbi:hypothetical protein BBJ28_00014545 [Nothophytophthora sp. Chile5]|nr:hypothetical protein BBJ28_00014545 [Nothophytophthora sp. Chile5]